MLRHPVTGFEMTPKRTRSPKMREPTRLEIIMEKETIQKIESLAVTQEISMSQVVREAIEKYLEGE